MYFSCLKITLESSGLAASESERTSLNFIENLIFVFQTSWILMVYILVQLVSFTDLQHGGTGIELQGFGRRRCHLGAARGPGRTG